MLTMVLLTGQERNEKEWAKLKSEKIYIYFKKLTVIPCSIVYAYFVLKN